MFLDESGIKDNTSATYDCKDKKSRRYRAIQLQHQKRISMMGSVGNQKLIFFQVFLTGSFNATEESARWVVLVTKS